MDKDADVPITRRQATFSVSLLLETIGWGWGKGHPDTCLEVKGQLQGELRLSGLATGVPAQHESTTPALNSLFVAHTGLSWVLEDPLPGCMQWIDSLMFLLITVESAF